MKKFSETNFGITLIIIVPAIIAYITLYQMIRIDFHISDLRPHLPFIISIMTVLFLSLILYIRKVIKEKIIGKIQSLEETKGNDIAKEIDKLREDLKKEFTYIYLKAKRQKNGRGHVGNFLQWDLTHLTDDEKKIYSDDEFIFLKNYKSIFKK